MQPHWNRGRRRRGFAWLALCVALAGPARAEEPAAQPPPAPAPPVELDRLLKLPPAPVRAEPERAGSASKSEWRSRFTSARLARDAAQTALDETFKKIGAAAGDNESWQITPPGAGKASTSEAPVNYQLRQEIRRQREELARAEHQIQELTIQADLAGVPASWRE